jgi:hypothetical protein
VLRANETDAEAAGYSWRYPVLTTSTGYHKEVLADETNYMRLDGYRKRSDGFYMWYGPLFIYMADMSYFEFATSLDHATTLTAPDPYFPTLNRSVEVIYHTSCEQVSHILD